MKRGSTRSSRFAETKTQLDTLKQLIKEERSTIASRVIEDPKYYLELIKRHKHQIPMQPNEDPTHYSKRLSAEEMLPLVLLEQQITVLTIYMDQNTLNKDNLTRTLLHITKNTKNIRKEYQVYRNLLCQNIQILLTVISAHEKEHGSRSLIFKSKQRPSMPKNWSASQEVITRTSLAPVPSMSLDPNSTATSTPSPKTVNPFFHAISELYFTELSFLNQCRGGSGAFKFKDGAPNFRDQLIETLAHVSHEDKKTLKSVSALLMQLRSLEKHVKTGLSYLDPYFTKNGLDEDKFTQNLSQYKRFLNYSKHTLLKQFKAYIKLYEKVELSSLSLLKQLNRQRVKTQKQPNFDGLDIASMLICPVQRGPRYLILAKAQKNKFNRLCPDIQHTLKEMPALLDNAIVEFQNYLDFQENSLKVESKIEDTLKETLSRLSSLKVDASSKQRLSPGISPRPQILARDLKPLELTHKEDRSMSDPGIHPLGVSTAHQQALEDAVKKHCKYKYS